MKELSILFLLFAALFAGENLVSENDEPEKLDWSILADIEWVWEENFYEVKFTESQKELDGKDMIVEGFMFPLEFSNKHSHFLVSPAPMSACYFCGPGEAESMVYVKTSEPIDYTFNTLSVQGTFRLVTDASMGIIYELEDARVVKK